MFVSCLLLDNRYYVCKDQRENLQKSSINAVISWNNRNNVGFVCVLIVPYKVMTNITVFKILQSVNYYTDFLLLEGFYGLFVDLCQAILSRRYVMLKGYRRIIVLDICQDILSLHNNYITIV